MLLAGATDLRPSSSTEALESLGGASLFSWPGALERLRTRPSRAVVLPLVAARLLRGLVLAPERRWDAHFLLPFGPLAALCARVRGVELTLVGHGSDVRLLTRMPAPLRAICARLFEAQRVRLRFVSEDLRRLFLEERSFRSLGPRTFVEPAALDVPELPSRSSCRASLGLPAEARISVVSGRLIESKRIDVALSALALLPGNLSLVLGDGPERAALERRFPEARFLGAVPRPLALQYLRAADLVVSTSTLEGAPSVVREARALDVPVVARRSGDLLAWASEDPGLFVIDRSR